MNQCTLSSVDWLKSRSARHGTDKTDVKILTWSVTDRQTDERTYGQTVRNSDFTTHRYAALLTGIRLKCTSTCPPRCLSACLSVSVCTLSFSTSFTSLLADVRSRGLAGCQCQHMPIRDVQLSGRSWRSLQCLAAWLAHYLPAPVRCSLSLTELTQLASLPLRLHAAAGPSLLQPAALNSTYQLSMQPTVSLTM